MARSWFSRPAIVFGILVQTFACSLLVFSNWMLAEYHQSRRVDWVLSLMVFGFLLNLFAVDVGVALLFGAYFLGMGESEAAWKVCGVLALVSQVVFWAWSYDYWTRPRSLRKATKQARQ